MQMFSPEDAAALAAFLASPERPAGTPSYHALQGFLFAVAHAPEELAPSVWLPKILREGDPISQSHEQVQAAIDLIAGLYNQINIDWLEGRQPLPADCVFHEEILRNLEVDAPISQFSRGLLTGHRWLEELWTSHPVENMHDALVSFLMVPEFFASPQIAASYVGNFPVPHGVPDLATIAKHMRKLFPTFIVDYAKFGRAIRQVRLATEERERQPFRHAKTGRNEPCPCGSGKKYKKCCGVH